MARVIDHRKNPRGGPRPSQTWQLIDPATFEKMKQAGAIREAPQPPQPAPEDGDDAPSAPNS